MKTVTDWPKLKQEYLKGGVSVAQLAEKHGLSYFTVKTRAERDSWGKKRKELAARIEARMVTTTLTTVSARASRWAEEQWERCTKFRNKIEESLDMTGGPIDPQALDQLTKAEMRVDDMGRRSLGLCDAQRVDVTSGGMPLSDFQSAMQSVRALMGGRKGMSKELDADAIASAPLDD
jgi:hypothetical protein